MIKKRNNDLWILELSVGFETNLEKNRNAKKLRYNTLIQRLKTTYRKVKFINLSLGAIGVYSKSKDTFSDLLSDLEVDKAHSSYVLEKISNVIIVIIIIIIVIIIIIIIIIIITIFILLHCIGCNMTDMLPSLYIHTLTIFANIFRCLHEYIFVLFQKTERTFVIKI